MARSIDVVFATSDVSQSEADHSQITASLSSHQGDLGDFSRRKICAHRSGSYVLFFSSIKLWKSMYTVQGLQVPRFEHLEEYIYSCFEKMYTAFEAQRHLVAPGRLCEIRYEDLVADPIEQMRQIYEQLDLGEFEGVLPRLEQYVADNKDYKTNKYEIDPNLRRNIDRRWGHFMRRYGYCEDAVPVRESA